MENFLIYLFKASIGIVLFYLFYLLVLRKETFYISNRLYLVSGLFLAVLLPAFPISYLSTVAMDSNASFFNLSENQGGEYLPLVESMETSSFWWSDPIYIITSIYLFGIVFFALRLIIQTASVFIKLRHGKRLILDGVSVVDVSQEIMPFSFFNSVIINLQEYSKEELSNIIAHEKVHIQERHWLDLLIIELLTVVFWINPIVWLYEKSIKQNHEYLADQGVLLAGYHPGQYQALLINQLMGVKVLGFTNNLNFSLNKKRMEMMKKKKSPEFNRAKLLIVLPVIAVLMFAFAKPDYIQEVEQKESKAPYEIKGIDKILSESLQLTGEVLTLDGRPIEGATFKNVSYMFEGISNKNGKFEIEIPKGYRYTETIIDDPNIKMRGMKILVSIDGFKSSKMIIDPNENGKPWQIHMKANILVTGRVINNNGHPLSDVKVVDMKSNLAATTNHKGEFEIASVQNNILKISTDKYKTIHYALVDVEHKSEEIVMKKEQLIKVRGTVTTEDGTPQAGANVILKGTTSGSVVDRQGKFQLEAPVGSGLVVSFIGYKTVTASVNASDVLSIQMEKRTFNIELPDVSDGNIKMQAPPPPPQKIEGTEEEPVFRIVEEMPYYSDGGTTKLTLDLQKETEKIIKTTADRGEVLVGFTVTSKGKVANAYVAESSRSTVLDESAVKIVTLLDNWNAGSQRGKQVSVLVTVPVKFN